MATIAEQLIGSAQAGIKEQGQATTEIIEIAQRAEQHQFNKQKFAQQQQDIQSAKINKFMNNVVQGAAMKNKKAQNLFFNKILPAQHQANGLEGIIPLDVVKSMAGDPETAVKIARIQANLREGTMTESEAVDILANPLKLSEFQVGPGELQTGLDALEGIRAVGQTGKEIAAQKFAQEKFRRTEQRQERESQIRETRAVRREEAKLTREDEQDILKFSQSIIKSGLPETLNTLKELNKIIPGGLNNFKGDIPGFGRTGNVPEITLSAAGKKMRQVAAELRNSILKMRSGGAVTTEEAARLLEELGMSETGLLPQFRTDKQFVTGLIRVRDKVKDRLATMESGFNPAVNKEFQSRFQERTGQSLSSQDAFFGGKRKAASKIPRGLTLKFFDDQTPEAQDVFLKSKGLTREEARKLLGAK